MRKKVKPAQLQIRVGAEQKRLIARAVGVYRRMQEVMCLVGNEETRRYGYAELNDLLVSLSATELRLAVASRPFDSLPPEAENYVAAMVEQACARATIELPAWTRKIKPLDTPMFGSQLPGLRLHLLVNSPAAFKRRNLFIDTSIGGRV